MTHLNSLVVQAKPKMKIPTLDRSASLEKKSGYYAWDSIKREELTAKNGGSNLGGALWHYNVAKVE